MLCLIRFDVVSVGERTMSFAALSSLRFFHRSILLAPARGYGFSFIHFRGGIVVGNDA